MSGHGWRLLRRFFWWIALASPRDAWHARVTAWEAVHPLARYVTTEEILSELLTFFAGSGPAGRAMRAIGISEVLSNDHHFTQEGFTSLFP